MKYIYIITVLILFNGCAEKKDFEDKEMTSAFAKNNKEKFETIKSFQTDIRGDRLYAYSAINYFQYLSMKISSDSFIQRESRPPISICGLSIYATPYTLKFNSDYIA
jgi:hypothetical protein